MRTVSYTNKTLSKFHDLTILYDRLDAFAHRSQQVGWAMYIPKLMASLHNPRGSPDYPHLALIDAMLLWGAHFSREFNQVEAEKAILARACNRLQTAGPPSQNLTHGLQGW